ncbi:MAG: DUF308 domain-containing protein [Candidatus Sacchiramonaceae bacterium]|nr:DUF308 domain-containing protein [Candidatus Saccharimonadaceae bacterium]
MAQLQNRVAKEANKNSLGESIAVIAIIALFMIPVFSFSSGWGWWMLINGLIFGFITSEMARKRGRSTAGGLFSGYVFGLLGVIYYLIAGDTPDMQAAKAEDSRRKLGLGSTSSKKQTKEELIEEFNERYNDQDSSPASVGLKVFGGISALILVAIIVAAMSSQGGPTDNPSAFSDSAVSSTTDAPQVSHREETIAKYSPIYCQNRQATKVTGMPEGYPNNDGSGWSDEECATIVSKVYDATRYDSEQNIAQEVGRVTDGTYWIGMSETALIYSLGNPRDINTTRFENYTKKQYVYGDIYNAAYIYVENGKVVTIQN